MTTIAIEVPKDLIYNLTVNAVEQGCYYWMSDFLKVEAHDHGIPRLCWYGDETVFQHPFSVKVRYDDPNKEEGNGKGKKTLTNADFEKGLEIMAAKYPRHFADAISGNDDAITADVYMQCVVLGEIVYG